MKKWFPFLLLTVLFVQCKNKSFPAHVYFWTSHAYGQPHLFVNDTDKGPLPWFPKAFTCKDDSAKEKALYLLLPAGKYRLAVKDSTGTTRVSTTFTFYLSPGHTNIGTSSNDTSGGLRSILKGDCMIEELFY